MFELVKGLRHAPLAPTLSVSVVRYSQSPHQRPSRSEPMQVIHHPARARASPPEVYWGWAWHMQTSIENLARGSVAVVELREVQRDPASGRCEPVGVAWRPIDLDDSRVDSRPFTEVMYKYPIDLSSQAKKVESDVFISGAVWITRAGAGREEEPTAQGPMGSPEKHNVARGVHDLSTAAGEL
jgi:hypothetical protein